MQDNFENFLSEKQELALSSLLAGKTRRQAAKAASVNEVTIYRWLNDDFFRSELRERQMRLFDETTASLYGLTEKAIKTLERNLKCGNPTVETKAALGIISQATRLREMQLVERIKKLEEIFEKEFSYEFEILNQTN